MSYTTSPSTPSRKRSRWDNDDPPVQTSPHPVPKRRLKTKPAIIEARLEHSDSFKSDDAPRFSTDSPYPSHSLYVPPRTLHPALQPSRSVYSYERLNSIEEGSYGVVFRARDKQTGDIVALKKLKLDEEKNGFPITALREINSLMVCKHENVVAIREVVVGDTLTQ